jgi:RNA polymerase sigma factor (TIGR02999 family)
MPGDVTLLLSQIESGDPHAAEVLLPLVYDELRRLAQHRMSNEHPGHTLQATALVHEAWLRLAGSNRQEWKGREHFFSAAAEAMRRILVDNARRKLAARHGGKLERMPFEGINIPIAQTDEKCLLVNECLENLKKQDPQKAEIVLLRVFVGLKVSEIAALLNCSEKSVQRQWNFAKVWMKREMSKEN